MTLKRLAALRFSGLFTDFGTLPIDATLIGATFDAVDTVQKWVFDGSAWVEFVSGTGEDNTGANVGVGTGQVFRDKLGVTLNFKTLIAGDNVAIVDNADDITIVVPTISPLTTKGDLVAFDTTNVRLPIGVEGQVLTVDDLQPQNLKWTQPIPFTAKGDLLSADAGVINTVLPVGTDGQILQANSAVSVGLEWIDAAAGSQTPILSDIDYDNFSMSDVNAIGFDGVGFSLGNAVTNIFSDITGIVINVPTGKQIQFAVDGVETGFIDNNNVNFDGKTLVLGLGPLQLGNSNMTISSTGAGDMEIDVQAGKEIRMRVNDVEEYVYTATEADWNGNNLINVGNQTFNLTTEPGDPTNQSLEWFETLDANNDVKHIKMKIDGAIKNVRFF